MTFPTVTVRQLTVWRVAYRKPTTAGYWSSGGYWIRNDLSKRLLLVEVRLQRTRHLEGHDEALKGQVNGQNEPPQRDNDGQELFVGHVVPRLSLAGVADQDGIRASPEGGFQGTIMPFIGP